MLFRFDDDLIGFQPGQSGHLGRVFEAQEPIYHERSRKMFVTRSSSKLRKHWNWRKKAGAVYRNLLDLK